MNRVRLLSPVAIQFEEAIVVAFVGLGVNLLSAWLLFDEHHHHGHDHGHKAHAAHQGHGSAAAHHDHQGHGSAATHHDHDDHDHADDQHHEHRYHGQAHSEGPAAAGAHDTNLRAAYLHVLADALTSVLAIFALLGGWWFGWASLDPLMGVVGALVIAHWSSGLLRT